MINGKIIDYNTIEYSGKKIKSISNNCYDNTTISIKNNDTARIYLEFETDENKNVENKNIENEVYITFSAPISELNIIEIGSKYGIILHVTFKTRFDESMYAKVTGIKKYKKINVALVSVDIRENISTVYVDIGNNYV